MGTVAIVFLIVVGIYFIIKHAVKNAIIEAYEVIKEKEET